MTRPLPAWFIAHHGVEEEKQPEPAFYIDRDIPPVSKLAMEYRLVRDQALQRWHTDRSIKVDFETWWKLLQRGRAA